MLQAPKIESPFKKEMFETTYITPGRFGAVFNGAKSQDTPLTSHLSQGFGCSSAL